MKKKKKAKKKYFYPNRWKPECKKDPCRFCGKMVRFVVRTGRYQKHKCSKKKGDDIPTVKEAVYLMKYLLKKKFAPIRTGGFSGKPNQKSMKRRFSA